MSKAAYYQRGETLDYTNTGTSVIEAGTILAIGKRIGVAATLIQPKTLGTVDVVGVFAMPKTSANAITMGTPVYFDGTGITELLLQMCWQVMQWPMQLLAIKKFW